ncbi:MAG: hypothetical protein DME05_16895, partial [Candidatus Rokuibacteriota bacterium]
PLRADRGVSTGGDGAHPAQEAPGLVRARVPRRRGTARVALRAADAGRGSEHLLGILVTQRYFEDFAVGDRFKSPSRTLTDAHFLFFAGMTGDNHPIHYDDEYGKKTRYGRRVAHGLLLTSLTAVGASTLAPVIEESIVAFVEQSTRFRAPVFIGDTIQPEHEVIALERKRSAGLLTLRVSLRNQQGKIVLDGEHRYLIAYRPTA